jgi:hypothetical protein
MPTLQHGRFDGPLANGPRGPVYLYYPPDGGTARYVVLTPEGHSFFSDSSGSPVSGGISAPSVAIIGGIVGAMLGGGPGALAGVALGALAAKLLPTSPM